MPLSSMLTRSSDTKEAGRCHSGRVQDPFETYMQEIRKIKLLSREEERALMLRFKEEQNMAVREKLIQANLRLVVHIAKFYARKFRGVLGLQDLIQEGNVGLIQAIESFDLSRDARLSTYAVPCIKNSIKRALSDQSRTIRIPAYMVEVLAAWRQASDKLRDELGRPPTDEEVAAVMNMKRKMLVLVKKALRADGITPMTVGAESRWSLEEAVAEEGQERETTLTNMEDRLLLLHVLDKMDELEATVLRMYYGIGQERQNFKQIGKVLGLSSEWIRQIKKKALLQAKQIYDRERHEGRLTLSQSDLATERVC